MPTYLYQPTDHFTERLGRIQQQDPRGHRRILRVIERILDNPADADGKMHGAHREKFKKYVGRGEYRILYYYCELCRKAERYLPEVCRHCDSMPDMSVVFFDVYHKNEKARLRY